MFLVVVLIIVIIVLSIIIHKKENFDAVGLVFNKPPNWFIKPKYNPSEWVVTYYPDQLSKPECVDYRGDNKELNYMSSAYRFWRF